MDLAGSRSVDSPQYQRIESPSSFSLMPAHACVSEKVDPKTLFEFKPRNFSRNRTHQTVARNQGSLVASMIISLSESACPELVFLS